MASGNVAPHSTSGGVGEGAQHQFKYLDGGVDVRVMHFVSREQAKTSLCKLIHRQYENAVKAKKAFTIVLSGGSLIPDLQELENFKESFDFTKWHVFWADERNVPHSDEQSNYGQAAKTFLSELGIPVENNYVIGEHLSVEQAATEYEGKLLGLKGSLLPVNSDGFPQFDMMLLGIGPDGHTASLFPNFPQLAEKSRWVLPVNNSPKPPDERITLTLPVINASKLTVIYALGSGKAEAVQRILEV